MRGERKSQQLCWTNRWANSEGWPLYVDFTSLSWVRFIYIVNDIQKSFCAILLLFFTVRWIDTLLLHHHHHHLPRISSSASFLSFCVLLFSHLSPSHARSLCIDVSVPFWFNHVCVRVRVRVVCIFLTFIFILIFRLFMYLCFIMNAYDVLWGTR